MSDTQSPSQILRTRFNELPDSDREFASSLLRATYSSPKQSTWIGKLIERIDALKSPTTTAQVDNVAGIVAMLDRGATKLKKPRIRFTAAEQDLCLSIASDRARYPGTIDVTSNKSDDWFGRIHRDGRFEPTRRGNPEASTAIVAALQAFAANPEQVAREYGRRMGSCCYCGRGLIDPVSVYLGYGPICAEHYGLPHRVDSITTAQVDAAAEADAQAKAA